MPSRIFADSRCMRLSTRPPTAASASIGRARSLRGRGATEPAGFAAAFMDYRTII
jgi:hypothetical protein